MLQGGEQQCERDANSCILIQITEENYNQIVIERLRHCCTYLSKSTIDLKQDGTHDKTLIFGLVFHALARSVVSYNPSVSLRNRSLNYQNWAI